MKNKLEVIKIFKEQIELIEGLGGGDYFYHRINTHRSYIADLVEKYIGSQSELLKFISNKNLFDYYTSDSDWLKRSIAIDTIVNFINLCIDFIDKNGVYKPKIEKKNFLGDFDNPTLWVIIPLFSTLLATGAYYVGRYQEKIDSASTTPTFFQSTEPAKQKPKQEQSNKGKESFKNK